MHVKLSIFSMNDVETNVTSPLALTQVLQCKHEVAKMDACQCRRAIA